jgi:hypothetical protein
MIRILICGGRGRMLTDTLDDLLERFGAVTVMVWGDIGAGVAVRRWAKATGSVFSTHIFVPSADLVVAFGSENTYVIPLRHAWKTRIAALRVLSDGTVVNVGAGWSDLMKRFSSKELSK